MCKKWNISHKSRYKDYSLTKEREEKINSLEINEGW